MSLAPGTRLGPYEILAPIGAGGMGEVYKARDMRLDRMVALKVSKTEFNERFDKEARAVAALNHPNICHLYDVGPDYLVMEYIEGKPIKGPLPPEETLRLALQITSALEEAHARGILHRDLKPGNIMVTAKGVVKLLDFGLAKQLSTTDSDATRTIEGMVVGTPAYMAPEQAQGKAVDRRSDVFSFGAVLYEMVSGHPAFGGDSTLAILNAVVREEPRALKDSPVIGRVIARCLRKSPADRFQTMAEVRAALEQRPVKLAELTPSIAVLPFRNMSREEDNEYFSDGLAEEIINLLGRFPGLKVIARTSAFAFRGKEQDIRTIAEALGVRTILEGSVRRAGNRIRIGAQLIDAEDGSQLWSERYDREMTDLFEMQDEIAAAIATALKMKLVAERVEPRHYTPKLAAYEALLRARYHLNKLTPESMAQTRECLNEVIALDPGYALAYTEIGVYFNRLAAYALRPAHEAMPLARSAVLKALAIDPGLPEALAMLATVAAFYDYDWNEAERLFRLATAGNPIPLSVRPLYALYQLGIGRSQGAIEELERALQEDPLNLHFRMLLVACFLVAGREDDADKECRRILKLDENYYMTYFHLSMIHAQNGKLEEAVRAAEKAYSRAPWNLGLTGYFAGLMERTGDTKRAAEMLQHLGDGEAYHAPLGFFFYALLCGEAQQAANWAEKAIEQRSPTITTALRYPLAKDLRSSSRWPALVKMMNQAG